MTFDLDSHTMAIVERLCPTFGVVTNADCLRKIIALANVASRYVDADGSITLVSEKNSSVTIILND
jgi:hypothetical protein